jgi:hypothetical protein
MNQLATQFAFTWDQHCTFYALWQRYCVDNELHHLELLPLCVGGLAPELRGL